MMQTTNAKIPLEVEGEVIYLDPNSAEGKALRRIDKPIGEDEWITVGEIGEEIDMEAINEKIKQRG
ncbi:MAG: hypothetical protein ACKO2V_13775, partial [Snowella sp.]